MVNAVRHNRIPQNVADRHRSREEGHRAIEIIQLQLLDSCDRLCMDAFIGGRQSLDRMRTPDIRWFRVHGEVAAVDAIADIRVTLGQVPRQLAQRWAAWVCGLSSASSLSFENTRLSGVVGPASFAESSAGGR